MGLKVTWYYKMIKGLAFKNVCINNVKVDDKIIDVDDDFNAKEYALN